MLFLEGECHGVCNLHWTSVGFLVERLLIWNEPFLFALQEFLRCLHVSFAVIWQVHKWNLGQSLRIIHLLLEFLFVLGILEVVIL